MGYLTGNIIVGEWSFTPKLRKVSPSGTVTTYSGNGKIGYVDGPASQAEFNTLISSIVMDSHGNFFVMDCYNNRIRKVTTNGTVSTFAGSDTLGYVDGPVSIARFQKMQDATLAIDKNDNLYVTDSYNHLIRKITPAGTVSTLAGQLENGTVKPKDGQGTEATFEIPEAISIDSKGNLYVADYDWLRQIPRKAS